METFERDIRILERRIARHDNYENLTAFYGSSTLRLWINMTEDMHPLNVINLGFGGSHFDACILYFDRVFKHLNPLQVVLYGGDNDLSQGYNASEINQRFLTLCHMIRKKQPKSKIFGITIKPSPQREEKTETILRANQLMKESLAKLGNADQIDTYSALLGSHGRPQPALYMEDGLHLNERGYVIWASAIQKLLI